MNFDLRFPLGCIFSLFGAMLVIYGAFSERAIYARSLGFNVNFWWGFVLLAFGLWMLFLAGRAKRRQK